MIAARVHLDRTSLDPRSPKSTANIFRGFVSETGKSGEWRFFTVADARDSLAAQRQFTDQLGIITAAFYEQATAAEPSLRSSDLG